MIYPQLKPDLVFALPFIELKQIVLNADGKPIMTWEGLPQKSPEQFVDDIKRTLAAHTETITHASK